MKPNATRVQVQGEAPASEAAATAASIETSGIETQNAAPVPAKVDHGVTRDESKQRGGKPALLEYVAYAQKKSGRSPLELMREFFKLHLGRGKLTFQEYVQYGVYDTKRYSPEEQSRFLSISIHWPITDVCSDMTWQAATEDKWLCSHILAGSDIAIPQTLAVIDKTDRNFIGTRKIATADELRDFTLSRQDRRFFGKENRGICSFGAFLVEDADADSLVLKGQGRLTYDAVMAQFVGETPYLLQAVQKNHEFFDRFTPTLATVRVCILKDKNGVRIPFAVLKLPSRENVADSFWRSGNLACHLDVATGEILAARSKDYFGTADFTHHPESGAAIVGETLPMWDRLIDLVHRCSPVFYHTRYQSMDIALTQDGPVLIEINTGGGFDLPQLASGQGFLTDEVCEFFRSCGYKKF